MDVPDTEVFETYDVTGRPSGLAARPEVHRLGLWHRAVNVFVFYPDGRLLIQQRHSAKDVCPGTWDLSVAEHLQPGESYADGARRGLREELGIEIHSLEPLGREIRSVYRLDSAGIFDQEFQQSFRVNYAGRVFADDSEIQATRLVSLTELKREIAAHPNRFTPWFRSRVAELGLVNS